MLNDIGFGLRAPGFGTSTSAPGLLASVFRRAIASAFSEGLRDPVGFEALSNQIPIEGREFTLAVDGVLAAQSLHQRGFKESPVIDLSEGLVDGTTSN